MCAMLMAIPVVVILAGLGSPASGRMVRNMDKGKADAEAVVIDTDAGNTADVDVIDNNVDSDVPNQNVEISPEVVDASPETVDVNDAVQDVGMPEETVDSNVADNDVSNADTVDSPDIDPVFVIEAPVCTCGDNFPDVRCNEECDDGNTEDDDGCSSKCCVEVKNWPARSCSTATKGGAR